MLDCDAGASNATIASLPAALQPYAASLGYAGAPLASQLLASSIWNPATSGSTALKWYNFSCNAAGGRGCGHGSPNAELIAQACKQELIDALNDADAWAVLWIPYNTTAVHLGWSLKLPAGVVGVPATTTSPVFEYIFGKGRSYSTYSFM